MASESHLMKVTNSLIHLFFLQEIILKRAADIAEVFYNMHPRNTHQFPALSAPQSQASALNNAAAAAAMSASFNAAYAAAEYGQAQNWSSDFKF